MFLERRQRAAEAICLIRGKSRADDRDLHGLFLKQRHAKCFAKDFPQGIRGKINRFFFIAPPDIGVDHITLNGAGTDDGDFDHKIIKTARFHAGQEIHLRAAFNLKDPDSIGFAEHIVSLGILRREACKRVILPQMGTHQIKAFAQTGEHAKAQYIHFENAKRIDVIFVPTDDRAVLHRCIFDGHQFIKPPLCDDKPADMLAEMAGKTDHLMHQRERLAQPCIRWIQTDFA